MIAFNSSFRVLFNSITPISKYWRHVVYFYFSLLAQFINKQILIYV